ncbi:hypothetical protein, partial [Streptococcus pseudopneumoniae]|uniref:hypothetical protein n=1 Tax=Streptococcus pseudopneumoniae TaxID=257758 RepID=UPI00110C32EB
MNFLKANADLHLKAARMLVDAVKGDAETLLLRIGLHTHADSIIEDALGQKSIIGSGIRHARRVASAGSPGMIILSQPASDGLSSSEELRPGRRTMLGERETQLFEYGDRKPAASAALETSKSAAATVDLRHIRKKRAGETLVEIRLGA